MGMGRRNGGRTILTGLRNGQLRESDGPRRDGRGVMGDGWQIESGLGVGDAEAGLATGRRCKVATDYA